MKSLVTVDKLENSTKREETRKVRTDSTDHCFGRSLRFCISC